MNSCVPSSIEGFVSLLLFVANNPGSDSNDTENEQEHNNGGIVFLSFFIRASRIWVVDGSVTKDVLLGASCPKQFVDAWGDAQLDPVLALFGWSGVIHDVVFLHDDVSDVPGVHFNRLA